MKSFLIVFWMSNLASNSSLEEESSMTFLRLTWELDLDWTEDLIISSSPKAPACNNFSGVLVISPNNAINIEVLPEPVAPIITFNFPFLNSTFKSLSLKSVSEFKFQEKEAFLNPTLPVFGTSVNCSYLLDSSSDKNSWIRSMETLDWIAKLNISFN
ncbi:hypothetical protein WICPIJ_005850 [Wickerhamomyces pijperi]|uniref:Uncharacterized protein n=1 Tax=Wickerhamomyces pijperi TaxID=599730 RepID=A0A9P8TLY7_WICPI|nr:hypothetical protein WICPIJ_005850 [Wickerhamomyces pijperi]